MRVFLRRAAFGLFWFGIFWMALLVVGGGIAMSVAGGRSAPAQASFEQGSERGHQAGVVAGVEFRERFGGWMLITAVVLATVCTVAGVLPGTRRK